MDLDFRSVSDADARHGVAILESEVIGLVPAEALASGGAAAVHLPDFRADMLLEVRLLQQPGLG
jgi:glutamate formiminotransferase